MRQAAKIVITDSIFYFIGQVLPTSTIVDHINVIYPLAKVYSKDNAIPIIEVFLQKSSVITWLDGSKG